MEVQKSSYTDFLLHIQLEILRRAVLLLFKPGREVYRSLVPLLIAQSNIHNLTESIQSPIQLEILRRAGAMPISSRRCGMITKREAERLCKSFLGDHSPPKLPENFAFEVREGILCFAIYIFNLGEPNVGHELEMSNRSGSWLSPSSKARGAYFWRCGLHLRSFIYCTVREVRNCPKSLPRLFLRNFYYILCYE